MVPLQSLQLLAALVYQSFIHIVTHSANIDLTQGPLLEASPKERQDYPYFSELIGESKDVSRQEADRQEASALGALELISPENSVLTHRV